jgi:hypothetical protein
VNLGDLAPPAEDWLRRRFKAIEERLTRLESARRAPGFLGAYATADRPTPPAAGWWYFDTTLGLPGFSDGTAWRDASGATI